MTDIDKVFNKSEYQYFNKLKTDYLKLYKSLPELYELYDKISTKYNNDRQSSSKKTKSKYSNSLEKHIREKIKIYTIKEIIDEMEKEILGRTPHYIPDSDYINYPNINDPNYQQKIRLKEEFNVNAVSNIDYTIDDKCSSKSFNLSNYQRFIKTFMSPETPYNGVLLFHGTGVGKTCSAVQIAEQFKDFYPHKIRVILSQSIEDGWKRTIFSPDKDGNQCTKNTYRQLLERANKESLIRKTQVRQVNKIIKTKYEFYGYQKFSNTLNNIKKTYVKGAKGLKKRELEIKAIDETFSNSLLIIDEVHNIRLEESTDKDIRNVIANINDVITHSNHLKLVLLSATPMFNRSNEIVFLLNLLLKNDNRNPIKTPLFSQSGNMTEEGAAILLNKSRGYISYIRGEDPITFPVRLYPNEIDIDKEYIYSNDTNNYPKLTFKKNPIPEEESLKFLIIRYSLFLSWQQQIYNVSIKHIKTEKLTIMQDIEFTQLSNIVYPENPKNKSKNLKEFYGQKGFSNIFNTDSNGKISYKKEIIQHYKYAPLDYEIIQNYSSKIFTILNSIVDISFNHKFARKGIVFIYTRYLFSGALPLAIALEHMGFQKHGGSNILDFPEYKKSSKPGTCKREKLSYNGLPESDKSKTNKQFKRGKYIILSGNQTYSKNNTKELHIAISDSNKDGEEIKIIIGTEVASEGVDLKYIREIHIMDPWRHLNKTEQIIGRGIRYCSHANIKELHRNVTVYLHSGVSDPTIESTDTYIYRQAEIKTRQIGQVENLLKKNALDCYLFRNNNIVKRGAIPIIKKMETYKKSIGKNIEIYDKSFSKICSYMEQCDYTCSGVEIPELKNKISMDTFTPSMIDSLIIEIINHIKNLYKYNYVYTINDIIHTIKQIKDYADNYIVLSINNLLLNGKYLGDNKDTQTTNSINSEYIITDKHNINGYLIKSENYCVFQPFNIKDTKTPMFYRENNYKLNNITNLKHIDLDKIIKERIKYIKEIKLKLFNKSPQELLDTEYPEILSLLRINVRHFKLLTNKLEDKNKISHDTLFNLKTSYEILEQGYMLDRLLHNDKYVLLSCLNFKIKTNVKLSNQEIVAFNYFSTLFINKDNKINSLSYEGILKLKESRNYLKAFVLIKKDKTIQIVFYHILNDIIKEMNTDVNKIMKNIDVYRKSGRFNYKNGFEVYGYVDVSGKKKDMIFKYKKTTDKLQKNKLPGQACGLQSSRDKSKLCDIIEIIDPTIHKYICANIKIISPEILCFVIECILRLYNRNDMNTFYKYDEMFIREPKIL